MEKPWKSKKKMDDDWGYPYFRKPPNGPVKLSVGHPLPIAVIEELWVLMSSVSWMFIPEFKYDIRGFDLLPPGDRCFRGDEPHIQDADIFKVWL